MSEDIAARADRLFEAATALCRDDSKAILAEHSAKGVLRSGGTIKRVTGAFAQRSIEALDEALSSISKRVDHRGRKWRGMVREVELAIDRHMDRAPDLLHQFTAVAGPRSDELVAPIIAEIRSSLHQRLADYRDGWTAPLGKPWRERNAVVYALLLILAGALAGEVVRVALAPLATSGEARQTPPSPDAPVPG